MRALLLFVAFLMTLAACDVRTVANGGLRRFEDDRAELLGILVLPEQVVVPVGATVGLRASGVYADRTSADLTAQVKWQSADPDIASVGDGLDEEGQLVAHEVGRTTVWARTDGIASPEVVVEVTDQSLDALSVEPATLSLEVGQGVDLLATARWSDETTSDAGGLVRWITDDPEVATISNGRLVAAGEGTTTIRAQWDEVESNPVPVTVAGSATPDLGIHSLTTWASGDDVTVQVVIENTGSAGASAFWVDVFLDPNREPEAGDVGEDWKDVSYVGPGETKTLSFTLHGVDEGAHEVAVLVDSTDAVEESDEGDNVDDTVVDVDGASLPPDIVVDAFTWLGDGTYVYYWIEISNYGDEPTGTFWVDLYLDRTTAPYPGLEGDAWAEVESIGAWETVAFEALIEMDCVSCWSWVQADTMDDVAESYESDNVEGPLVVTN